MLRRAVYGLCFFLVFGGLMAHASQQFLDAPQFPVGTNPQAVAYGDFNGDGKLDLAVVNTGGNNVSILLGNGDGTFGAPNNVSVGTAPAGIAVADFNGDGNLDFAVTNTVAGNPVVSIYLGNGSGGFNLNANYATGTGPTGVAAGDFNGDGFPDLVVANSSAGTVSVLFGQSGGTFAAQVSHGAGNNPVSIAVADFNGDGKPDFAVANKTTIPTVSVFLYNGTGSFPFAGAFQTSITGSPVAIVAGDFENLGHIDLAVACQPVAPSIQGTLTVLENPNGTGAFTVGATYDIGSSPGISSSPTSVTTIQSTNSGYVDLIVTAANDNTVNVLINNADGTGTFKNEVKYGTAASPYSAVVADFNGDGKQDIVVANSQSNSITPLLGNGNGTFQSRVDAPAGPNVNAVVVGDFNGDGIPDLAFANGDCSGCSANSVSLILGNGDGTYKAPSTFPTTTGSTTTDTYALVAADFNQDGNLDIAAVNNATNQIAVLLGDGTGHFGAPSLITVGTSPTGIVSGDFNQDGFPDLAVVNFGSNNVTVLINNQSGGFTATTYSVGAGPYAIARASFGTDTYPDLVVVNETGQSISVLINKNDGTFKPAVTYATGLTSPTSVAIGHLGNSGNLDLAIGDSGSAKVAILLGNSDGTFQTAAPYGTTVNVSSLVAADINGDGFTDLAFASSAKNVAGLLLGAGNGTFNTAATLYPTGSQANTEAQSIAVADLNSDGALDLVIANGLSSTASVLLSTSGTIMNGATTANNPSYGAPVTLSATVAPSIPGGGTITGTVTFKNGSTTIGSKAISGGAASITISTLPVGAYQVTAAYSGNYAPNSTSIPENVSQAGTTTVLSALSPVNLGQTVTFTATVCPAAGCPANATAPTGTVTFLDGATAVGTGTVSASGTATSAAITLAAGTHSITASYPGDTNYVASVSPAGNEVVNGPSFTFAATPLTPGSVAAGASSTSTITITPVGGLNPANVTLSCSSILPAATPAPACSFSAIAVSGGIGTSTLTVTTTGAAPALREHNKTVASAAWLLLPAAMFGLVFVPKSKRSKLMSVGLVALISAGFVFQIACGGGSGHPTPAAAATSTAVTSSANPAFTGQAVTFTAAVTSSGGTPTGTVTFLDGTTTLGTGTLASGSATYQTSSLAAGTHSVTASYAGDSSFTASTSTAVSQVMNASTASNTYAITVTGTATGAATQTTGLSLTVQ
jgi:hypothetical protein